MKHKIWIYLLLFILIINISYAVNIGISPGRVRYQEVLQGGYAERSVRITTNSEVPLNGHFKPTGEISEWLSFDPNTTTFTISKDDPYILNIIVEPPEDVRTGNYTGHIEFITDNIGDLTGRAGGVIKTSVILIVNVEVTGHEVIECRGGAFNLNDIEEGFPLELSLNTINDGNVRFRPTISLDIWDQLQENLLLSEEYPGDEVIPTTEKKITRRISHDLSIGQYWATIRLEECNAESTTTFSIVEKGDIVDKGYLEDILHKPWAYTGEPLEITAKFRNSGPRSVNAKFKGTIRVDDRIVKIIETDEILVPSSETGEFSIFFTPEFPGRYSLVGRVVYNKKLTFEKGTILNVNDAPFEIKDNENFSIWPLLLYTIIIVTIIFLVRKILKERKKKKKKKKDIRFKRIT